MIRLTEITSDQSGRLFVLLAGEWVEVNRVGLANYQRMAAVGRSSSRYGWKVVEHPPPDKPPDGS